MSINKGVFISPSITDPALKDTLQSLADAAEQSGLTLSNNDPDASVKARGGRLWYNATSSNLFIFHDDAWINVNPGTDTFQKANLIIFIRSSNAPATPTGGSYNFANSTLTPPTNWEKTIEDTSGTNQLYASNAVALISTADSDTIDDTLEWSVPVEVAQGSERSIVKRFYYDTNATGNSATPPEVSSGANIVANVTWAGSTILNTYTITNTGWSPTQPPITANSNGILSGSHWAVDVKFVDPTGVETTTQGTAAASTIFQHFQIDGLVVFTNINNDEFGTLGSTTINGGSITTGSIIADKLDLTGTDGLLGASAFTQWIANNAGGGNNAITSANTPTGSFDNYDIWFDSTNKKVKYYLNGNWVSFDIEADSIISTFVYAGNINASQINAGEIAAARITAVDNASIDLNAFATGSIGTLKQNVKTGSTRFLYGDQQGNAQVKTSSNVFKINCRIVTGSQLVGGDGEQSYTLSSYSFASNNANLCHGFDGSTVSQTNGASLIGGDIQITDSSFAKRASGLTSLCVVRLRNCSLSVENSSGMDSSTTVSAAMAFKVSGGTSPSWGNDTLVALATTLDTLVAKGGAASDGAFTYYSHEGDIIITIPNSKLTNGVNYLRAILFARYSGSTVNGYIAPTFSCEETTTTLFNS